MGQHKTNPTAIATAKGELPERIKIGKAKANKMIEDELCRKLVEISPQTAALLATLSYKMHGDK